MFTGIVTGIGRVTGVRKQRSGRVVSVRAPAGFLRGVKPGDSIACQGVCLTVASKRGATFSADISAETLRATTAGRWQEGSALNLEPALTLNQPLGGHLVSGHVDGLAKLESRRKEGRCWLFRFAAPRGLSRYIARKGSVCIDGVSLTVNKINGLRFELMLIPHTLKSTTLGQLQAGDAVNLEVDLVARYLERLNA